MRSATGHNTKAPHEKARERTGYLPSYAKAKKMKSLTLHTHGCITASLRDCSSSSAIVMASNI